MNTQNRPPLQVPLKPFHLRPRPTQSSTCCERRCPEMSAAVADDIDWPIKRSRRLTKAHSPPVSTIPPSNPLPLLSNVGYFVASTAATAITTEPGTTSSGPGPTPVCAPPKVSTESYHTPPGPEPATEAELPKLRVHHSGPARHLHRRPGSS